MATARQIRDLITETTTGSLRPRVPREVRDEVCRYAVRRRKAGAAWAVIARETGLDVRKLQRWNTRAGTELVAPNGARIEGLGVEQAAQLLRLLA